MKHYKFGGSTAKRTHHCQAWRQLSEGIPSIESEAAKKGTAVHYMLECKNLDEELDFDSRLGTVCPESGLKITHDMITLADDIWAVDEQVCAEYRAEEWEAETTGEFNDDIGSTVDKVFTGYMEDGRRMAGLVDYKSGRGFQVSAEGNEQLLHNAFCLMHNSEAMDMFEEAEILVGIIIQPTRQGDVIAKEWAFTKDMVDAFMTEHLKLIAVANGGEAQPNAGEHCAFCPAEATCPAKTGKARAALLRDPENLEILAENMAMVEELKQWCSAVEKAVYESLEMGATVAGFKLVAKQGREGWLDEEKALKKLRRLAGGKRQIVQEKLLSPAQLRKVLKARGHDVDFVDMGLTSKASSGNTIAPESDRRAAVLSADAFKAALDSVS